MREKKMFGVLRTPGWKTLLSFLFCICMMAGSCFSSLAAEAVRVDLLKIPYEISEGGKKPDRNVYVYYEANAADGWIEFALPELTLGEYSVEVIYKNHDNNGIFQTELNGETVGKPVNHHGANRDNLTAKLGDYTFRSPSDNRVRFTAVENEWKKYRICVKSLVLTPKEDEGGDKPIPDVNFGEKETSESGNVEVWPKPYVYEESADFKVTADGVYVPVVKYDGWYDYASFSMKGEDSDGDAVTVEIDYKDDIRDYEISPKKLALGGTVEGKKLTVTLKRDEYLIIRINNSGRRLVLLADPWEEERPESAGEGIFNVYTDYEADRTGTNLSTAKIQQAIDDASAYGTEHQTRGVVYVPTGVYQISTLALKSNVEMYLEGGAALRLTMDKSQYKKRGFKNSINKPVLHMLHTYNNRVDDPYDPDYQNPENWVESENIKIYGRGTIDGRGKEADEKGWLSETLVPQNCQNFTTDGIIFRESGVWSVNVMHSNDLEFLNFKVLNKLIHENDCIDVNNSQNVVVRNSIGIALDDPYSTKTWETGELFQSVSGGAEPLQNVLFEDCISWTCCYGFKVGQGSNYNQENVVFKDSVVYDCSVGIGIEHKYGTAELKGITFENIDIEQVTNSNGPLRSWLAFQSVSAAKDGTMPISDVSVKNITVYDRGTVESRMTGYNQENLIDGVRFEHIYMDELGRMAESLEDLNIGTNYFYARNISLDGTALPDAPSPVLYKLEEMMESAEHSEDLVTGIGGGYVYIGKEPGDWISFPIETDDPGVYRVELILKKHESKGIFQTYVNGEKFGDPYDQYGGNQEGIVVNLGQTVFEAPGTQSLKFQIIGKNEKSKGYQLALNGIRLTLLEKMEPEITGISIETLPYRTVYEIGEELDLSGMAVVASRSNAEPVSLAPEEYTVSGFDSSEAGEKTVTITYTDKKGAIFTARFQVTVADVKYYARKIEVVKNPEKTVYEVGDAFDPAGMVVEVIKKASSSNAEPIREVVDPDALDYDYDFDSPGKKSVTITYSAPGADEELKEFKTRIFVRVSEPAEVEYYTYDMKIVKKPAKTVYRTGDLFLPDGMKVVAYQKATPSDAVPGSPSGDATPSNAAPGNATPGNATPGNARRTIELSPDELDYEYDFSTPGRKKKVTVSYEAAGEDGNIQRFTDFIYVEVKGTSDSNGGSHGGSGGGRSISAAAYSASGTWLQDEKGWWFRYSAGGYPASKWELINGKWYYFDAEGYMMTGWQLIGGVWYCLDAENGDMNTGWYLDGQDHYWYYLDPDSGAMRTGWQNIGNRWYCFKSAEAVESGWAFDADCKRWIYRNLTVKPAGAMYCGETTPDGYAVGEDGAWRQ